MYGLTELGGLVAGESVVVIGPGPIGLLAVAVAKALGASPVILTGTRNKRLAIGRELGADRVINIADENAVDVVRQLTGGIGADYVVECAGTEATVNQAIHMANRGGKICLAAFPHDPVTTDLAHLVKNNIYVYGIRGEGRSATRRAMALMAEKRFDATKIHTHTFALDDLPTALRYARDRVEDAIKVVVTARQAKRLPALRRSDPRPQTCRALNSSQRRQDDLRRQRNLGDNDAERPERIVHRVRYRRGCPGRTGLTRALGAQFRLRGRRHHMADIDVGHFAGHRNQIIGHVGVGQLSALVVDALLEQRRPEALHHAAPDLLVDQLRIDDGAAVLDDPMLGAA